MIGGIVSSGNGNAFGQIKKALEASLTPTTPIAPTTAPAPAPTPTSTPVESSPTPTTPVAEPVVVAADPATPLTYSAPGPRQADQAVTAPRASLSERLEQADYYAARQSTPVVQAEAAAVENVQQEQAAAMSAAQVIAQGAYGMVARATETNNQAAIIQQA